MATAMTMTEKAARLEVTRWGAIGEPEQAAELGDAEQDEHRQPDQGAADREGPLHYVEPGKPGYPLEVSVDVRTAGRSGPARARTDTPRSPAPSARPAGAAAP